MRYLLIFFPLFVLLLAGCNNENTGYNIPEKPHAVSSMDGESLNVIVEIPAGTNRKIKYKTATDLSNDTLLEGVSHSLNFLPYPGNYGFVPNTLMDRDRGGDGTPIDVLVICESVPAGTLLLVKPIAALLLRERGKIDTKIIAVPTDSALRVFQPENFLEFALEQDAARSIIEAWFLNYKGPKQTELIRWEDETYAWREVRKWRLDK